MDTSDPGISFAESGVCSHCHHFDEVVRTQWFPNDEGRRRLESMVELIKRDGRGREYDCIIGLSGGVDSSYLALKVMELGLRPLVVHVDAGWNSELAVKNIESLVKALGIDLYTLVIDWEEMRDLQAAFLRAGVPNQDVPQDHAFFAGLYRFAVQERIRWVLSGGNHATEGILPQTWGYNALDATHLKAVHRRFGTVPLRTYPVVSYFNRHVRYPLLLGMKVIRPLDFLHYNKSDAMRELSENCGWRYYGGKHYESVYTKFFQGYWLPARFGYDKRRAHLSSLIVSGQISREAALAEIAKPAYAPDELRRDWTFVAKKLGFSEATLRELFEAPLRRHQDYPNIASRQAAVRHVLHFLRLGGLKRRANRF